MPWPSISFAAAPTLTVEFSEGDNNVFFLYPSPGPEFSPVGDTFVRGNIILNLPAPTKVRTVNIEVVREMNAALLLSLYLDQQLTAILTLSLSYR